jgi:hypothetical protein
MCSKEGSSEKFAPSFMISAGHVSLGRWGEHVVCMAGAIPTGFWWVNLKERDGLEDLGVDRIIKLN